MDPVKRKPIVKELREVLLAPIVTNGTVDSAVGKILKQFERKGITRQVNKIAILTDLKADANDQMTQARQALQEKRATAQIIAKKISEEQHLFKTAEAALVQLRGAEG